MNQTKTSLVVERGGSLIEYFAGEEPGASEAPKRKTSYRSKTNETSPAPKKPKELTKLALEQAAISYLGKYGGSTSKLQSVLHAQIERYYKKMGDWSRANGIYTSVEQINEAKENFVKQAEEVLLRLTEIGYLSDRREAASFAHGAVSRGLSKRIISQKLKQRGFAEEDVLHALETVEPEQEFSAVLRLSKKRGLGKPSKKLRAQLAIADDEPGGLGLREKEQLKRAAYQKDLAKLLRRGFSFDMARRALEAANADDDSSSD